MDLLSCWPVHPDYTYLRAIITILNSPININQAYAQGKTLNDVWAEPFFGSLRKWQKDYADSNGNWVKPCPDRDHHADFYRMLLEYEPEPADENAAAALLDLDYHRGLNEYDESFRSLTRPVWENHYMHPAGADEEGLTPLPHVFDGAN
jgi:hypothetical protein